ncbi:hypothetical protein [Streptomyces sp. S1D4-14]|uniref:hypothetical protein n=1 Tax=Streptomyces sp. S1D4-14 TaxID=2594461 RepID=UPI001162DE23|nr:hypothetical protein [Streptomyces sp. S1D4-14]QDN64367.1 hypothetical protein FNV66_00605 [Streptomyces sp. S1D4-14]
MATDKMYERTEDGVTTHVSIREAMAEVNHAMMDGKRDVREMSSGRDRHWIDYKDGRSVRLTLVDAPAETAAEDVKEWSGTASNGTHVHRFDAELKALCNRRIRSRGAGRVSGALVGHGNLRSRREIESSEYAYLYTFCSKCEDK